MALMRIDSVNLVHNQGDAQPFAQELSRKRSVLVYYELD